MAFVILDPCRGEKAGECVTVCPVDCIEEGPEQFYIDPDICIDCAACVAVCPVDAIVEEYDLAPDQEKYLEEAEEFLDRKSTRLNSSHVSISYAVFCLKKKNT